MIRCFLVIAYMWTVLVSAATPLVRTFHLKGWYETEPAALQEQLAVCERTAQQRYNAKLKDVRAVIIPHAGYRYSGALSAAGLRLFEASKIRKIILLAPCHSWVSTQAKAFVTDEQRYRLPLGSLALDKTAAMQLVAKNKKLFMWGSKVTVTEHGSNNPFDTEHSMEIELPLVYQYLPGVTVLPIIVGHNLTQKQCEEVAKALKPYIDEATCIVVSSDFLHYGRSYNFMPFQGQTCLLERIRALTNEVMQPIFNSSFSEFQAVLARTKANVCGYEPISILLSLLADQQFKRYVPYLVGYATSSDDKKDQKEIAEGTVSYGTIAFARAEFGDIPLLTNYEKQTLVTYVKNSIQQRFSKKCGAELLLPILSPGLQEQCGTFVTLRDAQGTLRGCVGTATPRGRETIQQSVLNNGYSAAFSDRRFSPLASSELAGLQVEISLLSRPIETAREKIKLGDGVIFTLGDRSALFLPEVAQEQGWDLATMFAELSRKAGLPSQAWKDKKARFSVFKTEKLA